jgi:hypothetical protein
MPISKNMNTKNKNAKQCAANSYTPQHSWPIQFGLALVQSEQVFTKDILQNYTNMSTRQVKTSDDPKCIFRFMLNRIKKDGTRNFIIHLNDEHLLMFVNYLEEKLTSFKKYRSLFKGVTMAATLSTADNIRFQLESTKYAKHFFQFYTSPLSVVLSTFEDGHRDGIPFELPKKTTLVFVSEKQTSYFNQAYYYFSDNNNNSSTVKKIWVSQLPTATIISGFTAALLFLDKVDEMEKVARFLNDNNFIGRIIIVNVKKDMLKDSEFQKLLGKKGLKIKSICSGVKNNVEEGKYLLVDSLYEKQVIEIIKTFWIAGAAGR